MFVQNPQAFANQYTLMPFCETHVNQAHMKKLALSDGTSMTQVQGDNKVAYCDILPARSFRSGVPGDQGGSYHEAGNLLVMHITSDRPHANAIPVYFLPWEADRMFRMKLKPSPHHAQKTETWFFGLLGGGAITPNVFVTAAVQGCSVFVEGDPASPVVYHVNAVSTDPAGGSLDTTDHWTYLKTAKFKADYMTSRMQLGSKKYPKTMSAHAPGAVHLMDYMPAAAPANNAWLTDHYKEELRTETATVYQFGTIFGIRESKTWVFYRQTRTMVDYQAGGRWVTEFRNPMCLRFWP
jgi:hypothetical protein